jgi:uncharacterized membrane protein
LAWKKDRYVMFYAKQSLVLFIFSIIVAIVRAIFAWIPVIGLIIAFVLNILVLILWIYTWAYALSGKEKDVLIIGKYARKIKL